MTVIFKHMIMKRLASNARVVVATLQQRQVVISTDQKRKSNKEKATKSTKYIRAAYSAVSTRFPTTPTPSTCFSSSCTFSWSSSSLCFSSIHRISRRS